MADSLYAIGWLPQTAVGTAATVLAGANFVEQFSADLGIKYRIPKYKTNKRIMQTNVIPTTTDPKITIGQADVDATDILPIFASAFGPATGGVYKFGQALNSTPASFLTVKWAEGLAQSWQMLDCRVDTFKLQLDAANGTLRWDAMIPGVLDATQPGSAWTPTYTLPVGQVPYGPWQARLSRGATCYQVMSLELDVNNHFDPLYTTGCGTITTATPVGITPQRRKDGEAEGTFKLTYEYTGETGSSYSAMRTNTREAWHLTLTDPTPTTGKTITIDIPVVGWTQGQLAYDQAEKRQIMTGSALYDATSGTSITVTVA